MEVVAIFYMWDNSWVYQIGYPDQPSKVYLALGLSQLILSGLQQHNYSRMMAISGIIVIALSLHQSSIEKRRLFDASLGIDEIKLRINHYFKRKQAILSYLGLSVLTMGLLRSVLALWILTEELVYVAVVDVVCIVHLFFVFGAFCLVKFST